MESHKNKVVEMGSKSSALKGSPFVCTQDDRTLVYQTGQRAPSATCAAAASHGTKEAAWPSLLVRSLLRLLVLILV